MDSTAANAGVSPGSASATVNASAVDNSLSASSSHPVEQPKSTAGAVGTAHHAHHKHSDSTDSDFDQQPKVRGAAPSCQLFNLFKAFANTGSAADTGIDSDPESEAEDSLSRNRIKRMQAGHSSASAKDSAPSFTESGASTASSTVDGDDGTKTPHDMHDIEPAPIEGDSLKTVDPVKLWLQDTMGDTNENIGTKFAALSLNNMSSYSGREKPTSSKRRPTLQRLVSSPQPPGAYASVRQISESPTAMAPPDVNESSSDDEFYEPDTKCFDDEYKGQEPALRDDGDSPYPTTNQLDGPGAEWSSVERAHIPDAEKLKVIIDEFGPIDDKFVNADGTPAEPEVLLAQSNGSLFKGVMMVGNLHLTNYRVLFHAMLPPDADLYNPSRDAVEDDGQPVAFASPDIVHAGAVTCHRNRLLGDKKRRVWMELTSDMLTTYPSADESGRQRPLFSVLLSTALRLAPYNEIHPRDFYLTYESPDGERTLHFSADNQESAMMWRRQFEGSLFRYARQRFRESHQRDAASISTDGTLVQEDQWSMLRCCVPFDRTTIKGIGEYHSFATLVNLEVATGRQMDSVWPEDDGGPDGKMEANDPPTRTSTREGGSETSSVASTDKNKKRRSLIQRIGTCRSRDSSPSGRGERTQAAHDPSPLSHVVSAPSSMESDVYTDESIPDKPPTPTAAVMPPQAYMDTAVPPSGRFAPEMGRTSSNTSADAPADAPTMSAHLPQNVEGGNANVFQFLLAVLNEQKWFADSLQDAVHLAHQRKLKAGALPTKMVLDIGGYDCLALDDDVDSRDDSLLTEGDFGADDDEDERRGMPSAYVSAHKAEKMAMAARVFGLREEEGIWMKRCYLAGGIVPARGHIILTPRFICFWRRARVGADIKYRFNTSDVKQAIKSKSLHIGLYGLAIKVHGRGDFHFEMPKEKGRDEVIRRINLLTHPSELRSSSESIPGAETPGSGTRTPPSKSNTMNTMSTTSTMDDRSLQINPALVRAGTDQALVAAAEVLAPPADLLAHPAAMATGDELSFMPFVANRLRVTSSNFRLTPRRFAMLTIGSRGDVQPYIALGLRLMKDGHKVVIITHDEFKSWIEGYGIEHRQAGGDPTALMKLSGEHRMFSPGFFKDALGSFRQWLDELLVDSWHACHDADVLIESPSAMAGVHIAEALKIPYFRAFTMPWTRTSAYPQAFMVPAFEMGPSFNYSTYVLFDNIMWRASSGQINRWRKKYLDLGATDQTSLSISKVPFLYNFSSAVVPKPLDWLDDITITGYWNLEDSDTDWSPPDSLKQWMAKARADGKPIVYIGFGSIVVPDPVGMTRAVIKGVTKADVRAIIAKGWSVRDMDKSKPVEETSFPDNCYALDKVPHSWLFPNIDAAMHHGGAGTVGASLRAGIPTLIKPWFGDQHFWALRVTKLGVGVKVASLRSSEIADALIKATTNTVMIEKAARIGQKIRSESGVDNAAQAININISRAGRNRVQLRKEDKHTSEVCPALPILTKASLTLPRPKTQSRLADVKTLSRQSSDVPSVRSTSGSASGNATPPTV